MNDTSVNSFFVALLFILRCVVPLAILFGISYLLRKMGLVAVETPEPPDYPDEKPNGISKTASPQAEAEAVPVKRSTESVNPRSKKVSNEPKTGKPRSRS